MPTAREEVPRLKQSYLMRDPQRVGARVIHDSADRA